MYLTYLQCFFHDACCRRATKVAEWGHTIEDIEWTIENVQELADLWLEAERIRANGKALADWIEADPKQHFQQVIELWNSCRVS